MSGPRLKADQKNAILADYLAGVAIRQIAAAHGVHQSYPGHLARRRGHSPRRPVKSANTVNDGCISRRPGDTPATLCETP